jgi:hypothetical protein
VRRRYPTRERDAEDDDPDPGDHLNGDRLAQGDGTSSRRSKRNSR